MPLCWLPAFRRAGFGVASVRRRPADIYGPPAGLWRRPPPAYRPRLRSPSVTPPPVYGPRPVVAYEPATPA